jgi:hypothetical protein
MITDYTEIKDAGFGNEIAYLCSRLKAGLDLCVKGKDTVEYSLGPEVTLYKIWTDASLEEVRDAIFRTFPATTDIVGAGERFRSKVAAFSAHDREGVAYYIIDTWSLNI